MISFPNFPYDWIAPGEFPLCGKCGNMLILPDNSICMQCLPINERMKLKVGESILLAEAESNRLKRLRYQVARSRIAGGCPARFWKTNEWVEIQEVKELLRERFCQYEPGPEDILYDVLNHLGVILTQAHLNRCKFDNDKTIESINTVVKWTWKLIRDCRERRLPNS